MGLQAYLPKDMQAMKRGSKYDQLRWKTYQVALYSILLLLSLLLLLILINNIITIIISIIITVVVVVATP